MAGLRKERDVWAALRLAVFLGAAFSAGLPGWAQAPSASPEGEQVVEVRVVGCRNIPIEKVLPSIRTRAGRPFNAEILEEDVRRLHKTRMFFNVKTFTQQVPGGRVVIFEVLERPQLNYVKYVGNRAFNRKRLEKESGLKDGEPLDTFEVEEAQRRLEEFYHGHGYPAARVTIFEGDKPQDHGAVFLINEGTKQRIGSTRFMGNTIASDARLRTQIRSKPGVFWIFKGGVDRKQIDEDLERLTAYYRSLGFFRARVGRELSFHDDPLSSSREWLTLTFVIDEGPRYTVRNVSVLGNKQISTEELTGKLALRPGDYFDQSKMRADVSEIQDRYGSVGYVFADVKADPRFLEEPGQLDLVYSIAEGKRYRVGRIDVQIQGEIPHTRITTVLNRVSLQPGDIVDIRELRASERRLKASQLFEVDPTRGVGPKIVFTPPELGDAETSVARQPQRPGAYRGQSPDPPAYASPRRAVPPWGPDDALIGLEVQGKLLAEPPPVGPAPAGAQPADQAPPQAAPLPPPPTHWAPGAPLIIRGQNPDWEDELGRPRLSLNRTRTPQPASPQAAGAGWPSPVPAVATSSAPAPGWPSPIPPQKPIYRGQYSPDAGQPVPSFDPDPRWFQNHPSPRPATSPSASAAALPPGAAAPSQAPAPAGAAPSTPAPPYGNQAPWAPGTARPAGASEPGLIFPGQPTINDERALLGLPPDEEPPLELPLDIRLEEARTGRLMFSVGVNSDAGLIGTISVDEQNFDWTRWPRSWADIRDGVAWRGAGQRFRVEAVPGTEVQRYTASFQEPYLFDTQVTLGLSGYYYNRAYTEWLEERLGGRVALGYQFTHDLSATVAYRGAKINLSDPIIPTPVELQEALGDSYLHGFQIALTHDTRDSPFLATEGHLLEASFEEVIGTYQYPRVEADLRRYFMLFQRPDGSGRHVISLSGRVGYTGDDTPIYEHYFAGGFSTIRGFRFREASPRDLGVPVGGEFLMLASAEYMFPITADDMLRMVVFCDTGTVEPRIDHWTDKYRVSAGVGLRITIPAMGPAPIALDFAFPISKEPGDEEEVFSFFIGFLR